MTNQAALEAQIEALDKNVTLIRSTLDKMAEAINRLAVLEERGSATAREIKWVHTRIDDLSAVVRKLEENSIRLSTVVTTLSKATKVFWALFGAVVVSAVPYLINLAASAVSR